MHPHPSDRTSIIVPLYQYPLDQATWMPLYEAISNHPSTTFIVIINPNSGPGVDPAGWRPDGRYSREILKLKIFANVVLVGYVRLDYCRRPFDDIQRDIEKYASWSQTSDLAAHGSSCQNRKDLCMEGIFFDEVPNIFSEAIAEQLAKITKIVRDTEGLVGHRWVIHNPGTIPDFEFLEFWATLTDKAVKGSPDGSAKCSPSAESGSEESVGVVDRNVILKDQQAMRVPDVVVIFEGPYSDWQQDAIQKRIKELSRYSKSQCCHIVHSVPRSETKQLVVELEDRGSSMYVTELTTRFYESFGQSWCEFTNQLESLNSRSMMTS